MRCARLTVWTVLVLSATAGAQMKQVHFKDGRPALVGTVTQREGFYEILTPGGAQVVPAGEVAAVTELSPRQEFRHRQAALGAGDVAGHYDLASWAHKQGLLEDARAELKTVLALAPAHENAKLLAGLVDQAIAERRAAQGGPEQRGPGGPPGSLMSAADVQRIRRAELRSRDRVAVEFRNDVLRRYVELQIAEGRFKDPAEARAFHARRAVDQAIEILMAAPEARDLHEDIVIRNDPVSMLAFKQRIWPLVARQCATPECHGSPRGAGKLKLYPMGVQDERVLYTNFYILDAYESGANRIINRNVPEQSLLLQYGLPTDQARAQHPHRQPTIYRNAQDSRYQGVLDWISNALLHPRPAYNLEFRAPVETPRGTGFKVAPETAPATRPATRPAAPPLQPGGPRQPATAPAKGR